MVTFARLLLEAGGDQDFCDCHGMTALMLAADKGHLEVARLLLEAGADKDTWSHRNGSNAHMLVARVTWMSHVCCLKLVLIIKTPGHTTTARTP